MVTKPLGRVLRPAGLRAGIAIEEHRDGIPAAQEPFRHHLGAVGALQAIELACERRRRLRLPESARAMRPKLIASSSAQRRAKRFMDDVLKVIATRSP